MPIVCAEKLKLEAIARVLILDTLYSSVANSFLGSWLFPRSLRLGNCPKYSHFTLYTWVLMT